MKLCGFGEGTGATKAVGIRAKTGMACGPDFGFGGTGPDGFQAVTPRVTSARAVPGQEGLR